MLERWVYGVRGAIRELRYLEDPEVLGYNVRDSIALLLDMAVRTYQTSKLASFLDRALRNNFELQS